MKLIQIRVADLEVPFKELIKRANYAIRYECLLDMHAYNAINGRGYGRLHLGLVECICTSAESFMDST